MRGLKGKNILITGAGSGIGEAAAIRFGEESANVAINYYGSEDQAIEAEKALQKSCNAVSSAGCKSLLIKADISRLSEVEEMFRRVLDGFGSIDILINNAGASKNKPPATMRR